MEKLKNFIYYCKNELQLLGYSLIFSLCYLVYGKLFDFYNISAVHRFWIILFVGFSISACSQMFFIFKSIFKK